MDVKESVIWALSGWDYGIIVFYALFVSSIGLICRRLNKNSSDYFRGGGNMLWWVGGVSALVTGISTWTFTGGAAKCYLDGFLYPLVGLFGAIPAMAILWYMAPRFRRMRVITAMEGGLSPVRSGHGAVLHLVHPANGFVLGWYRPQYTGRFHVLGVQYAAHWNHCHRRNCGNLSGGNRGAMGGVFFCYRTGDNPVLGGGHYCVFLGQPAGNRWCHESAQLTARAPYEFHN